MKHVLPSVLQTLLAGGTARFGARALLLCLLSVLCTGLGACGREPTPATGVVVVVYAETAGLAEALDRVSITLFPVGATDPKQAIEYREFGLAPEPTQGRYALPFSFGILKGTQSRFLLVVHGFTAGSATPVIEHKVIGSFQNEQTLAIDVLLSQSCYDRANECSGLDRTCKIGDGLCAPVLTAEMRPVRRGEELTGLPDAGGSITEPPSGPDANLDAGLDADTPLAPDATSAGPDAGAGDAGKVDPPEPTADQLLAAAMEAKLRQCNIVTGSGFYNIGLVVDDWDRCIAACIANIGCTDLHLALCFGIRGAYADCHDACPTAPADGFLCGDGSRIPHHGVCDGDATPYKCPGHEDELGCETWACDDGQYVTARAVCDGTSKAGCADGSDEKQNCASQCK